MSGKHGRFMKLPSFSRLVIIPTAGLQYQQTTATTNSYKSGSSILQYEAELIILRLEVIYRELSISFHLMVSGGALLGRG